MVSLELFIRKDDIKALLKQITNLTTKISPNNPLLHLSIVDEFLLEQRQTIDLESREYAISDILLRIVADQYHKYCDIYEISSDEREDLERMLNIAYQGRRELGNLSGILVLYFIYVKVDSNLLQEDVLSLISTTFSHLSRIRDVGVSIVHKYLIEMETESRRKHYQRRLRQSLPNGGYLNLLERDREVIRLIDIINNHKNILVTGIKGVGKSSLVEAVINEIIAEIDVKILILWLDLKQNNNVEEQISAYYPYTKNNEKLNEYLSSANTIIVADSPNSADINYLANHFSLARIIAISENMPYQAHFWQYVYDVKPLRSASSERLIQHIMGQYEGVILNQKTVSEIITLGKGIPQNIIALVANYCSDYIETSAYIDHYLALTSHAWLDANAIVDFWGHHISLNDVIHNPYVEVLMIEGRFHARLRDHVFVQFNDQIISTLVTTIDHNSKLVNPIFPDVLYGMMKNNIKIRETWIVHVLDHYSSRMNNWVSWLEQALDIVNSISVYESILIKLSHYYRRIGQPTKYMAMLDRGKTIWTQIELLRCMQSTGQFEIAFERLFILIKSNNDPAAANELWLLMAQLYIDAGNLSEAHKILEEIQPLSDTSTYRFTYAELQMQIYGDVTIDVYSFDENIEQNIIDSYHHYLLGRKYFSADKELALEHFLRGLQLVSQQSISNKMIVGRYLSNIGACHVELHQLLEARQYLSQSLYLQKKIGDNLGILYTEKSITELEKLEALSPQDYHLDDN